MRLGDIAERRARPSQTRSTLVQSRTPSYGGMTVAIGTTGMTDGGASMWFRFGRSKFSDEHKLAPSSVPTPR